MKKYIRFWIYSLFAIGAFLMFTNSCKKDEDKNNNTNSSGTVTDIDGNVYNTVTIGTQVWLAENLNTTKYRNGESIPNITDANQWKTLTTGAQCNHERLTNGDKKHGKLYNWFAVNDNRNIAPPGWHVATDYEWSILYSFLYANYGASISISQAIASNTEWYSSQVSGSPGFDLTKNNKTGFNALPSGDRDPNGIFYDFKTYSFWWSSTQSTEQSKAYFWRLSFEEGTIIKQSYSKQFGYSVRCVKD